MFAVKIANRCKSGGSKTPWKQLCGGFTMLVCKNHLLMIYKIKNNNMQGINARKDAETNSGQSTNTLETLKIQIQQVASFIPFGPRVRFSLSLPYNSLPSRRTKYLESPRPLTCKASQQYPSCAWTHLTTSLSPRPPLGGGEATHINSPFFDMQLWEPSMCYASWLIGAGGLVNECLPESGKSLGLVNH